MTDADSKPCVHCHTPFVPTADQPDFCCSGCQFVYDLIQRNDLGKFYDLQDAPLPPVKSTVFQPRDYTWLGDLIRVTESPSPLPAPSSQLLAPSSPLPAPSSKLPAPSLDLSLQGVSCVGCVWLIEKLFARKPGALAIEVDAVAGRMNLTWSSGEFDAPAFAQELQRFGYLLGPPGAKNEKLESRGLALRMGPCGAFAMNAMLFTLPNYLGMDHTFVYFNLFNQIALACSTLSLLVGGSYFITRAWRSLRLGVLHIDLPISLGLIAAYAASLYAWHQRAMDFVYSDFVSIFTFLMLFGRWLQQTAIEKNRSRLLGLQAIVRDSDTHLKPGDVYTVDSGQVVPVRSRLRSAAATLGLEWINGESEARESHQGDNIPSGATQLGGASIELDALEPWSQSLLHSLLEIQPKIQSRHLALETFLRRYLVTVLFIAAGGFAAWWFTTHNLLAALQVLTSVLVVSCPCAAGVALPLADELCVAALRRVGVFVREHSLFHRLLTLRHILFDKTGTLTLETMSLKNPEALTALTAPQRATLLHLVSDSRHPVSCCLREHLLTHSKLPAPSSQLQAPLETVGHGLSVQSPDGEWRLGRPGWAGPAGTPADSVFALNGVPLASFRFAEAARPDAREEVARLQQRGLTLHILSGDQTAKVERLARELGVDPAFAHGELTPSEKASRVREIDRHDTLMIGDGANDSLAFNTAWCTGTPAVDRGLLEQKADFYFLGRGVRGVRQLLDVARDHRRLSRRVIAFALAYNAITVTLCLAGKMNPLAASILMPSSSLVSLAIVYAGRPLRRV